MYTENFSLYANIFYFQKFAQKNKNTLGIQNFLHYVYTGLREVYLESDCKKYKTRTTLKSGFQEILSSICSLLSMYRYLFMNKNLLY